MQPNPFTPAEEEKKNGQEPAQSEVRLPDPPPAPAPSPVPAPAARPAPAPVQAKKPSQVGGIAAVLLGLVVIVLLIAVAGLGFWAYSLNTKLADTQQQLTALQGDYGKLQTDYTVLTSEKEKLNADLTQAKADLEKANADLATAQTDLQKARDENKAVGAKMDKAGKLADVLFTWFTSEDASGLIKVDAKIKATSDTKLASLWEKYLTAVAQNKPGTSEFGDLLIHLVTSLNDNLK
ncbi:MAG TPA: hypothetical protein VHP14_08315 [Anaerolineales bacterium]|nr:hypothetical protein [Anaerolineales bacterium]